MKGLDSFKSNIKAAEDMLNEAKQEYRQKVLELIETGEIEEVSTGSWMSIFADGVNKFFCTNCNGLIPIKYYRCPICGARMTNACYVPRYRRTEEEQNTAEKQKSEDRKDTVAYDVPKEDRMKDAKDMLSKLMGFGYSMNNIQSQTGLSFNTILKIRDDGSGKLTSVSYNKMRKFYDSVTSSDRPD